MKLLKNKVDKDGFLRPRMAGRQNPRLRQRITIVIMIGAAFLLPLILLFLYFSSTSTKQAHAAANGDFKAVASGNWNTKTNWQKYNGTSWVTPTAAPNSGDGIIEIPSGIAITASTSITADQVLVGNGGQLTISSNTFTLANGTGTDMTIDGTLVINSNFSIANAANVIVNDTAICQSLGNITIGSSGANITITSGGLFRRDGGSIALTTWSINSGGTYRHNMDGGSLPTATWGATSNCEITGIISTTVSNLNQSFGNFTWNSTSQTAIASLGGNLKTITGNLTFISTGTSSVKFNTTGGTLAITGNYNHQGGTVYLTESGGWTINVAGNFNMSGGIINMTDGVNAMGDGNPFLNITGSASVTGGTIDMSQYTGSNSAKGIGTINLYGDLSFTGGTIRTTSSGVGNGQIFFAGTTTQNYISGGTFTGSVDATVNTAAILNLGSYILTGGRNFTVAAGATIILGDINGITSSGASGNVQFTGTRSYSTDGKYTYKGSATQVTGNGLPSSVNTLTIDNASGLTLTNSVTANYNLVFTNGNVTAVGDTLGLGFNNSNSGTLTRTSGTVIGWLKRWISANGGSGYLYPLSNNGSYRGANLTFTGSPTTGGYITINFVAGIPGNYGLPITESGVTITSAGVDGYWNASQQSTLGGGTYNLDLYAYDFSGVLDYTQLRIIRRTDSSSPWEFVGTHAAGTGSNSSPIARRTAISNIYDHFTVGGNTTNPLPVELVSFNAKAVASAVQLTWATASETNNDYFTIERSGDGKHFEEILRKNGAGNSTTLLSYSSSDDSPLKGMNYYRLRQTDYDGKFVIFPIKSVEFGGTITNVSNVTIKNIAPNPFTDNFNVNFNVADQGDVEIQLMNNSGQMVFHQNLNADKGLNTFSFNDDRGLAPGIYFVNIINNGEVVTKKIIKQ